MQEIDADRRLQRLRGIDTELLPSEPSPVPRQKPTREEGGFQRKRRRIAGEDDTDRDIRFAQEDVAARSADTGLHLSSHHGPLADNKGHITLFSDEQGRRGEKNAEAELDRAKKKREYEDQYTMRFSNAAGARKSLDNPWYSSISNGEHNLEGTPGKDVWGNEDPRRKEREKKRLDSSDPLSAMQKGLKQLRQAEKHRKEWMEQREKDLEDVERMARENRRRKRHRVDDDEDSLEDFSLDAGYGTEDRIRRRHTSDHKHRRHHRRYVEHRQREAESGRRSDVTESKRSGWNPRNPT